MTNFSHLFLLQCGDWCSYFRANNPLESWNAVFNRFFPRSPIMTAFIAVIRNCSQEKYNDLVRIQLGQNNRKIRKPPSFPVMSADYASFVPVPVVAVPAMLAAPAVVAMAAPVMVAAPAVIAMPVPAVPARALIGPIVAAGAMAAPAVIAMPAPAVPARALIAPMIAPFVAAGAMAAPAVIAMPAPVVPARALIAPAMIVAAGAMAAPAIAAGAQDDREYTEFLQADFMFANGDSSDEEDNNVQAKMAPASAASSQQQQQQQQ